MTSQLDHQAAQQASAALPPAPDNLREQALREFASAGFPTTSLEDWKYTNLREIADANLPLAEDTAIDEASRARLAEAIGDAAGLAFVNGRAVEIAAKSADGALLATVAHCLEHEPERIAAALRATETIERSSLVALNSAFLGAGAVIDVPDDTVVETPIHLVYAARVSAAAASHVRNLISVGRNSRVTVVEHYLGLDDSRYWTNTATDAILGDGAKLSHCKIQSESGQAHHTADISVVQGSNSQLHSLSIALGSRLCRNDIRSFFGAPGGHCSLDGLYMVDGQQHVDHHTSVDHAAPHCSSTELYKGILGGSATGVFNGKVLVRNEGQQTDAHQLNKNLLLSEAATINTKPQLEIFADDVKCSHGATTGRLDEDAIFFLRARAIDEPAARRLLTRAFANEIVGRIDVAGLRERVEETVDARLAAMIGNEESK